MSEARLNLNRKDVKQLLENVRTARESLSRSTTENRAAMEQRLEDALRELSHFCRIYDSLSYRATVCRMPTGLRFAQTIQTSHAGSGTAYRKADQSGNG